MNETVGTAEQQMGVEHEVESCIGERQGPQPSGDVVVRVSAVLRDRTLITFALVAVGTNSTFYTFTSLWGTPFLTTTGMASATAATVISVALPVYGLTSLAVGRFSDAHGRKPATMVVVGVVGWVAVLQQAVGWLVDIGDGGPQSYAIGIALVAAVATIGLGFALRTAVVARRVDASVGASTRA